MRNAGRVLGALLCTAALAGSALALRVVPGGRVLALLFCSPGAAFTLWQQAGGKPPQAQPAAALAESSESPPQPTPEPSVQPTPSPTPQPTAEPEATPAPTITIPPGVQTTAPILDRTFGQGSGQGYIALAAGSIKNATDEPDSTIASAAQGALSFTVTPGSPDPQVLILHTHATETYQTWDTPVYDPDFTARTKDTTLNMCAVGEAMTKVLNDAGITTLHDTTLHDSPSYTESYARSAQTARRYLEEYPSIKVVLDVHRDAMESGDARVRPLTMLDGQPTAQVMIIAGCNNGGTVQLPNWRLNLCFAAKWEERMEMLYPGLTRPVLCGYRFYNQDVSPGALLIEIGGHANTVQQAVRAGQYAAKALAALFDGSV